MLPFSVAPTDTRMPDTRTRIDGTRGAARQRTCGYGAGRMPSAGRRCRGGVRLGCGNPAGDRVARTGRWPAERRRRTDGKRPGRFRRAVRPWGPCATFWCCRRIARAPLTWSSVGDWRAVCVRPPGSQGRRGERPDGDRSGPCAAPATGDGDGDSRTGARCGRTRDTSGSVGIQRPASGGPGAAANEPIDMGQGSPLPSPLGAGPVGVGRRPGRGCRRSSRQASGPDGDRPGVPHACHGR